MAITYRGVTITFGKHSDCTTNRRMKEIAFPGVDGTQEMDMGKRARLFDVSGLIEDMLTGSFRKSTLEAWNDGCVGILDIHGIEYTNVRMAQASFSEAWKNSVTGKLCCTFDVEFRKLQ